VKFDRWPRRCLDASGWAEQLCMQLRGCHTLSVSLSVMLSTIGEGR
jgi:hypothetical protein